MEFLLRSLLVLAVLAAIAVMLWPAPDAATPPPAPIPAPPPTAPPGTLSEVDTAQAAPPPVLPAEPLPAPSEPPPAPPPAPPPSPSGLIIPVAGIEAGDLVDTFDASRSEGRSHDAIDIIAPHRTPVLAAADGRIVRLYTSDKGGLTIYQRGTDERTVYYYAHLDGYAEGLEAGDDVKQGAVIGYVGDTGNAGPGNYHLHFAIWHVDDPDRYWGGEPINPYPLLNSGE